MKYIVEVYYVPKLKESELFRIESDLSEETICRKIQLLKKADNPDLSVFVSIFTEDEYINNIDKLEIVPILNNNNYLNKIKDDLYNNVINFFTKHEVSCEESIVQCESVYDDLANFVEGLYNVVERIMDEKLNS